MAEIYHVVSRGVDKRKIFMDDKDRFRFIHDLFEFNDQNFANTTFYVFSKREKDIVKHKIIDWERKKNPRKLLVELCAFCLMPNHYHLLLSPLVENGVTKFMKKLNMGYAKYFNERYQRTGALFEGRYKRVLVERSSHFIHLPFYIHLNPLDFEFPEWRDRKLKSLQKAINFLENYRWSSHLDYLGRKNFASVTQRDFLNDYFGGPKKYEKAIQTWLKDLDTRDIKDICLESLN